jgi:hypothetical protein
MVPTTPRAATRLVCVHKGQSHLCEQWHAITQPPWCANIMDNAHMLMVWYATLGVRG